MSQKVARRSSDPAQVSPSMRRLENSVCQPISKWVPLSKKGRISQYMGKDRFRLLPAVPMIQCVSLSLRLLGYENL